MKTDVVQPTGKHMRKIEGDKTHRSRLHMILHPHKDFIHKLFTTIDQNINFLFFSDFMYIVNTAEQFSNEF